MAVFSDLDRKRMFDFLYQSFDVKNAGDMEAFAINFLHSGRVWDLLAENFPSASASVVKLVMMEAYAEWGKEVLSITSH